MGYHNMNRSDDKPVAPANPAKAVSLLERAAQIYDFDAIMRTRNADLADVSEKQPPAAVEPTSGHAVSAPLAQTGSDAGNAAFAVSSAQSGPIQKIDREALREGGFIVPDGAVTGISEEFRIIKRQLLLLASGGKHTDRVEHGERILICSAQANEGKTFCAINLALSIAAEKDNEVLLVDADFAKPSVLATLGLTGGKGLMDALSDPAVAVEDCIIATDILGLSVLPSGIQTNNDTEYLASARTRQVLDRLTQGNPRRIVIFDSPPALAASPASELAMHVGQAVMIVRADRTTETALRDALGLMSGCDNIQLLLNGTKFSPTGRSFGSYYGYGE